MGAALLYGERDFLDRIYPNISVRGVSIGGMRVASARGAVMKHYASFLNNPITITYGERVWRPSASDLGVQLQVDEAIARAHAIGRGQARSDSVKTVAATWQYGIELPLHISVDQIAIQQYVLNLSQAVEQVPVNADAELRGAELIVTQERFGTQVLVDETMADVTAALQGLDPQQVMLRTRTIAPQVRDSDVAPMVARIRTMLNGPIVIASSSSICGPLCRWSWSPERIASWLDLRRTTAPDGRPDLALDLDQNAIKSALLPIAAALREEGTLPQLAWNGGDLRITVPGDPGRGLDAAAALAQVNAALTGGPRNLDLGLVPIPPPVNESNLASLGITEAIGVGTSSFANSEAYRITNIRAGARQMNGILIPPGGSFSFNDNLGEVTAENGFVEGYAIVDNRTQKEWGGGLCQVSTTVFRAAFWGGLPISERHEHSFRIGWYEELGEPPGLDAAIFTGVYDLRFENDTDSYLLIESYVNLERQRLTVALYGKPTGRQVAMDFRVLEEIPAPSEPRYIDDPELPRGTTRKSDTARGGLRVEVYRSVSENGAQRARNTFPTEFKPWPDIYVRGTGGA
jgi:vancomycin resistance protein YoaR